jgi:1-acyl-sn-glycerol-3-phosphate acyltransferase
MSADLRPYSDDGLYRSRWRSALRVVFTRVLLRALIASLVSVRTIRSPGLADVDGGFVLVANHSSHLDAPVLAQALPQRLAKFLATGVASDYFFTRALPKLFTRTAFNAFPIDRKRGGPNSGLSGRLLKAGIPILVFPEATRSRTGRMQDFSLGPAALAMAQRVPVLPVALIGTHEAMPKGRRWPIPGRPPVTVVFGEPLWGSADETYAAFTGRIQRTVAALYAQHHPSGATLGHPGSGDGVPHPSGGISLPSDGRAAGPDTDDRSKES